MPEPSSSPLPLDVGVPAISQWARLAEREPALAQLFGRLTLTLEWAA